MKEGRKETYPTNNKQSSGPGMLLRIFWMMIGNLALFVTAFAIYESKKSALNLKDGIYWIIIFSLATARYIDIKYLDGLTASGSPASIHHWYRYVAGLIICAGLIWGTAHLANYFFT